MNQRLETEENLAPDSSPRPWPCWLALLLMLAVGGLWWLYTSTREEPEFYRAARVRLADARLRQQAASQLAERAEQLAEDIQTQDEWEQEFTQRQINSWLIEELPRQARLPKGLQNPLIELGTGLIQIGCWIESPKYKGVVSVALRPSVQSSATLAFDVESIHAGKVPVPPAEILSQFSRSLERQGLPVEIDSTNGERILVDLREAAPQLDEVVLTDLEITPQRVAIRGTSEPEPPVSKTASNPRRDL
jgi:hypothetical protein